MPSTRTILLVALVTAGFLWAYSNFDFVKRTVPVSAT